MVILINKKSRSLFCDGKSVFFSKKEFLLMELIISNLRKGNVQEDYAILQIWDSRYRGVSMTNLSQLVYLVRKKIIKSDIPLSLKFSKKNGILFHFDKVTVALYCNDFFYSILKKIMR